jgi:hypothetical protein
MPSRSVRPAGKRHSHGGYVGGADAPGTPVTCQGCAGQRQGASGSRCRLPRRSKRQVRWALPPVRASGQGQGAPRGPQQRAPDIDVPGKLGRGRPQPGRMPRDDGDCRHRERSLPHGGCVRPGRPTAGRRWPRAAGVTLAMSVRGHSFRAAACCCRRQHGTAPGNSGCGPLQAWPVPGEAVAGAL